MNKKFHSEETNAMAGLTRTYVALISVIVKREVWDWRQWALGDKCTNADIPRQALRQKGQKPFDEFLITMSARAVKLFPFSSLPVILILSTLIWFLK